jgi:hypothetical protein
MHRALAHFKLGPMNVVTAVALLIVFSAIWLALLPRVCRFWSNALETGVRLLPLSARLDLADRDFHILVLHIPYLRMEPVLPNLAVWSLTAIITVLFYAATYFLPAQLKPVIYIVRGIALVQASALVYFALWPASFPHTPDSYMQALVVAIAAIISIIPLVYALTFYIFDFGLAKKALLTALTMAHLTLFLPLQVLLQALVLQQTVLFMPVLYIVFGMMVDVLIIIGFYSWGMTWSFRPASSANR